MLAVVLAILVKIFCHFKTRIKEHIKNDNKSHIFKHLHSTTACFDSHNYLCFKIIDKANSKFDLKIKESLHINWRSKCRVKCRVQLSRSWVLIQKIFLKFRHWILCDHEPFHDKIKSKKHLNYQWISNI